MKIKREYEIKRSWETERSKEVFEQESEKNMSKKENKKSENNGEVESLIQKEIQKENDKRREKEESKEEEEESFCVKQKDVRVAYCSNQLLLEPEYKKICFATNDVNFFLPSIGVSISQKFKDEFAKDVRSGLPTI